MKTTLIDPRLWGDAVIGTAGQMAKSSAAGSIATRVAGHALVWIGERVPTASKPAPVVKAKAVAKEKIIVKAVQRAPAPKPASAPQQWPVMPSRISPVTEILRKAEKVATRMRKARRGPDLSRLLDEMEAAQRLRAQALMTKSQGPELWAFGSFGAFA